MKRNHVQRFHRALLDATVSRAPKPRIDVEGGAAPSEASPAADVRISEAARRRAASQGTAAGPSENEDVFVGGVVVGFPGADEIGSFDSAEKLTETARQEILRESGDALRTQARINEQAAWFLLEAAEA